MSEPNQATIIVSAFEPFGGATVNASEQVLGRLMEREQMRDRVRPVVLPVVRGAAEANLLAVVADTPEVRLLVSLGEAGPETVVRLEMVALNFDDFRIPDNGGNQPRHEPIAPDGPAAYFATAPVQAALDALEGKTPLPVRRSLTAGAFVCNHLFYAVSHDLQRQNRALPFVFVHVPAWRPERGTEELNALVETVGQVLEALDGGFRSL